MLIHKTPETIRRPFANYSHAVEIPPNARLLFCSGQLAVTPEDIIPLSALDQANLCFDNIEEILKSANMALTDVVRINAYVTGREHMAGYMQARDLRFDTANPPASTLMIVGGFTREEFTVEIEAIAAKCD